MPFPISFARHTLMWRLPDNEVAQCRIHWAGGGGLVGLDDAFVDALHARAVALWDALDGTYHADTKFIGSRVALIGVNGNIVETKERLITPNPGTSSGQNLPTEVAVCVSLWTGTNSRSGRGRVYMPAVATPRVVTGGRFDTATRDGFAKLLRAGANPNARDDDGNSAKDEAASANRDDILEMFDSWQPVKK